MRLRILPIFIISSLLTVGLFGIFGISMTNNNGQHTCPISALSSDDCSPSNSPIAEAFHHISGLQNLAQGAINTNTSFLALSILLILAFSLLGTLISKTPSLQTSPTQRYRDITESHFPTKKQFLRWLALHQKRDPNALQWVHNYS